MGRIHRGAGLAVAICLAVALAGWLSSPAATALAAAGRDQPAGQLSLVEIAVPSEGVDPRFAAIVAIVAGAIPADEEDGTVTFLVPAAAEERYRRLFQFVFSLGEGAAANPRCRPPALEDKPSDQLIVRVHKRVSPELVEILAAVYGSPILGRIESLNAYLLVRPETLCIEDFKELLLLSPLVSSVERNAPVYGL